MEMVEETFDRHRSELADRDRTIAHLKDAITLQNRQTEDLLRDWEAQRQEQAHTIAERDAEIVRLREALSRLAEAPFSGWTIAQAMARQALGDRPHD